MEPFEFVLAASRRNFDAWKNSFKISNMWPVLAVPPLWMFTLNNLCLIYFDQINLLRKGHIVWGSLVQANEALFEPGRTDLPASVIYSPDPYFDKDLDLLNRIARSIFELKGTRPSNPELLKLAQCVTNEFNYVMKKRIPMGLTEGKQVYMTTIMVSRKHLPGRILSFGNFPLLVLPEKTNATLILPSCFWPEEFKTFWENRTTLTT